MNRKRLLKQGCGLGLDVGLEMVSRRTKLPTSHLDQNAQRLGLVSVSDLCVSDLVSVSTRNVSGLGPFRLVKTFHAGAPNLTTILHFAHLNARPIQLQKHLANSVHRQITIG